MAEQNVSRTAPFYLIPPRRIVSVEHPAIIRNVDKAIDTLGGGAGIAKILNPPKADAPANLLMRPEDALSRPLQSTNSPSNNILLRVTVPKRTGRKRKRGSNEPFTDAIVSDPVQGPPRPRARELLRSLHDNVGAYQVEPVGLVERTHVFRGMPDFVFATTPSPFISRFREHILPFDYQKMKHFDLEMSKGAISNVDIIPPPSFSHGDVPFNYNYRQNPTVKQSIDNSGNVTTVNTQRAVKVLTYLVPSDIARVPSQPRDNCPPISTLDPTLQETITAVRALFETRPAWTRRGLRNSLKTLEQRYALRHAVPYVGYIFRSGPWRDAIIKFGHDPRSDPSSRIYQTTMFRILPREAELARDGAGAGTGTGRRHTTVARPHEQAPPEPTTATPTPTPTPTSHIFTGQPPLALDGRMWMFCDITDPLLHGILFPSSSSSAAAGGFFLRPTCDIASDGWFGSGTLAKAKAVMRAKIQALFEGRVPDDGEYAKILTMPDHASPDSSMAGFWLDAGEASTRELQLASEVRSTIKGTVTWREQAAAAAAGQLQGGTGTGTGTGAASASASSGTAMEKGKGRQQIRFEDEDGEEGEEEGLEREEILEAVGEVLNSVGGSREQDDDDDDDDDDDENEN
ncbi:hypothetical protein P175DRAFT_0523961 [Aspergillus ochraceoroseus IBT 24754]|uniref:Transcription factor IIIC subunit 5 HTH domain-containing protein n=1 Tax=Aspergillus ochraceoroseus IBT 24754 TaxID=1392256 RepID=A0A2T5LXX5_9EURO|nr:uncharacterized protein P175DRAFT_0523961 [Aspergillus ochraceoroseus IBT 24754]PTU21137.1 hypothetical protein P175DRAFT_0523961 [Aspergillus ochraceoroseus IBT 24754]